MTAKRAVTMLPYGASIVTPIAGGFVGCRLGSQRTLTTIYRKP